MDGVSLVVGSEAWESVIGQVYGRVEAGAQKKRGS